MVQAVCEALVACIPAARRSARDGGRLPAGQWHERGADRRVCRRCFCGSPSRTVLQWCARHRRLSKSFQVRPRQQVSVGDIGERPRCTGAQDAARGQATSCKCQSGQRRGRCSGLLRSAGVRPLAPDVSRAILSLVPWKGVRHATNAWGTGRRLRPWRGNATCNAGRCDVAPMRGSRLPI
jgi:hypothetical protein